MKKITIATDGSCPANPGPAGWAWFANESSWKTGFVESGTNNIVELTSILECLRAVKDFDGHVTILSDSQYAIKSITLWSHKWKQRGWKRAGGREVVNVDIIKAAHELFISSPHVKIEWVKGHNGHELNEMADKLAGETARLTPLIDGAVFGPGLGDLH